MLFLLMWFDYISKFHKKKISLFKHIKIPFFLIIKFIDIGKRIAIIGFGNGNNIGNNLLKYSMFILLKSLGFQPKLVSLKTQINIYFLKQNLNLREISNYSEDIHENNYDFFVVNSDQVWSCFYNRLLKVGFLSFTNNWNVSKFVYATSLGYDIWSVSEKAINSTKKLVKQFSGISVREQNSIKIIQKN